MPVDDVISLVHQNRLVSLVFTGIAMESPVSLVVADIVMQHTEERVLIRGPVRGGWGVSMSPV